MRVGLGPALGLGLALGLASVVQIFSEHATVGLALGLGIGLGLGVRVGVGMMHLRSLRLFECGALCPTKYLYL